MNDPWRFTPDELISCALDGGKPAREDQEPLSRLLSLLYQVSLCSEERRPVRLSALLVPAGTPFPPIARFPDRPTLTVQRLRKLGPAFDPGQTVLIVEHGPDLLLTGVGSRRMATTLAQRLVPQGPWSVEVRGVAEIHLRHPRGEAVFSRIGTYRPDDPASLAGFLPPALAQQAASEVLYRAQALFADLARAGPAFAEAYAIHAQPVVIVRYELTKILRELALAVRRQDCGGAFLVLADEDADLGDVVDSLHRLEGSTTMNREEPWAGCLAESLALRLIEARNPLQMASLEDPYLQRLVEADAYAQEEVLRTASLARIDGAVVLGLHLEPRAVGAKLRTDNYDSLPPALQRWLLEAEKGTRHKSVACAVAASPGSAGVVVSQDGEISLFSNPEGTAVRMRPILA
jgi:hypothetical protein